MMIIMDGLETRFSPRAHVRLTDWTENLIAFIKTWLHARASERASDRHRNSNIRERER